MESLALEITNVGMDDPIRPIRVWLAIARHRRFDISVSQAVEMLRSVFGSMCSLGTPVSADAIWMAHNGKIELVFPAKSRCSFVWSMTSLGMLVCEVLAGDTLPDNTHPQLALNYAKARTVARDPGQWIPSIEYYLKRMLGLAIPFKGLDEAAAELNILFPVDIPIHEARCPELECRDFEPALIRPKATAWMKPAAVGAAVAFGLSALLVGSYAFGRMRAISAPLIAAVPVAAQKATVDLEQITKLLEVLRPASAPEASLPQQTAKKASTPPLRSQDVRERPRPGTTRNLPQLQGLADDDGPTFVPGPAPMAVQNDGNRVKDNDFVAIN